MPDGIGGHPGKTGRIIKMETFNWRQIGQIVGAVLIALGIHGLIKLI